MSEATSCTHHETHSRPERRRAPRFPFVANVEIIEAGSSARLQARVSELSLYGCYVDILNPLPANSQILVKIFRETEYFEARATVIYSQPNLGMGLAFHDVHPHFLPTLRTWLREAMQAVSAAKDRI